MPRYEPKSGVEHQTPNDIFFKLPINILDQQFLIQIASCPPKSKISAGPARLHVQDLRFSMTTGVPPKLVGVWELRHLRYLFVFIF